MQKRDAWERFYGTRPRPWGGAIELPAIPESGRVLEIGCGGGRMLLPCSKKIGTGGDGAELVGMDPSRNALLALAGECPGVLVQGDVASLPFGDGSFSLVICRHVLEHLRMPERTEAAAEMLRVLKKGGRLHFEAFSTGDARFRKGKQIEERTFLRGDGIIHHYFEEEEARHLFKGASAITIHRHGWSEKAGLEPMARESLVADVLR